MKFSKSEDSFEVIEGSFNSLLRARHLLVELVARELKDKYLNHSLGSLWAFLNPLLYVGMYIYLFTYIFPAKFGVQFDGVKSVLYLLVGITMWNTSAEVITRAMYIVGNNASLVKQIVFPIEVLPAQSVGVAFVPFLVGLIVVSGFQVVAMPQNLLMTTWMLPLVFILFAVFLIGLSFFLASIGPFSSDLKEVVAFFCSVGMFLAPVLYFPPTIENLPNIVKVLINFNPFTHFINAYRDATFFGGFTHPISWIISSVSAILTFLFGLHYFGKAKPYFSEAI